MKKILFILVVITCSLVFCGCTTSQNQINNTNLSENKNVIKNEQMSKPVEIQTPKIKEINCMYLVREGNATKIQFNLIYENGSIAKPKNGKVILTIYDDSGLLYNRTYNINELQTTSKFYEIKLPPIKGFYDTAKFVLTFKSGNISISKTIYGTIEKYSPEEIQHILENEYHEHSIKTNIEQYRNETGIKFIVKEYGYCRVYDNTTGKIKKAFRVDFIVKNLNQDDCEFSPMAVCLIHNNTKYWKIGGLDDVDLGIYQEINGYWLFNPPNNISDLRLDFKIGEIVYDIPLSNSE